MALVAELATSSPTASAWLDENKEMWSWASELEFNDQELRSSVHRLLNTSVNVSEKDPEQELVLSYTLLGQH